MPSLRTETAGAVRDAVPFLAIMLVWLVVSLLLYGLFMLTKPGVEYPAWTYATPFVPGLIGFFGHALRQALAVVAE
ncbi:hypothetical protein [Halobellus sp. EA9]|uniref:hypothetical protein n=1 Tax=Halobellus sp. EA9 TaxID=3421647 RepID=UPI003EB91CAA